MRRKVSEMFIAYQTMARPSYMSGPRHYQQIYGRGDTAEEAIRDATTFQKNGETWSYGSGSGHPNACDLSVEEVDDDDDDDDEVSLSMQMAAEEDNRRRIDESYHEEDETQEGGE